MGKIWIIDYKIRGMIGVDYYKNSGGEVKGEYMDKVLVSIKGEKLWIMRGNFRIRNLGVTLYTPDISDFIRK